MWSSVRTSTVDTSNLFASDVLGGTVPIGTAVNVAMQFDRSNHQLIFTGGANSKTVFYGNDFSDASSPGLPFKVLEVSNNVANCTTLPGPSANISALFHNVSLNLSAVGP